MVFDRMGVLLNRTEVWLINFDLLKEYIDENNKRPSEESHELNTKKL